MKKNATKSNELIATALQSLAPGLNFFKPKLINDVRNVIFSKIVKKGEFVCKIGEKCNTIGILIKGELKAFYLNDKAEEIVSRFYYLPQNPIVVCMESFANGTPSFENIQATSDCSMLWIDKSDLNMLYNKHPGLNAIGRHQAEQSYCQALRRIHILQTMKAPERYKEFEKANKHLFNIFSAQDIASYLGMHRNRLLQLRSPKK